MEKIPGEEMFQKMTWKEAMKQKGWNEEKITAYLKEKNLIGNEEVWFETKEKKNK